nr:MAG TPA: hypothetical protein [Caudoviricetes sp.]DAX18307.1 MAG TPA: hypothetical protein [Caudoviricetes sp.]
MKTERNFSNFKSKKINFLLFSWIFYFFVVYLHFKNLTNKFLT